MNREGRGGGHEQGGGREEFRPLHLHGRVSYAYFSKSACPDVGLFSLGEACSHVAALMFKDMYCHALLGSHGNYKSIISIII